MGENALVLGGAASGKSLFAEGLVLSMGRAPLYLATAQPSGDAEMLAKIAVHQARRGAQWRCLECPLQLAETLSGLPEGEVVLVDCITLWLTNHILAGDDPAGRVAELADVLKGGRARVVMVSNEVGHGIVPANALSRQFREAQGRANVALAAAVDLVVMVVAGLPMVLKGRLPAPLLP